MSIGKEHGLTPAWRRMLFPVRYLRVRQPRKRAYDLWWPLALALLTVGVIVVLPVHPHIIGPDGFLKGLRDLIGLLAAFFVAALAAVSTVERKALDADMRGASPMLDGKPLSRRQFVCLLFGYLSVLAFALYMAGIVADMAGPSLKLTIGTAWMGTFATGAGFLYALAFWNMACTTLLGIWFLVERVPLSLPEREEVDLRGTLVVHPGGRLAPAPIVGSE